MSLSQHSPLLKTSLSRTALFQKGILTLHDVAASRKQLQPILNPKEFSKIYEQVGHILNGL